MYVVDTSILPQMLHQIMYCHIGIATAHQMDNIYTVYKADLENLPLNSDYQPILKYMYY